MIRKKMKVYYLFVNQQITVKQYKNIIALFNHGDITIISMSQNEHAIIEAIIRIATKDDLVKLFRDRPQPPIDVYEQYQCDQAQYVKFKNQCIMDAGYILHRPSRMAISYNNEQDDMTNCVCAMMAKVLGYRLVKQLVSQEDK